MQWPGGWFKRKKGRENSPCWRRKVDGGVPGGAGKTDEWLVEVLVPNT